MIAPFDIFRTEENGDLLWLEAVPDLETAKARVQAMGTLAPGRYMILSQRTGNKLCLEVDNRGRVHGQPVE